jgi:hypothetical protein
MTQGEIVIYQSENAGETVQLDVRFEDETVWLSQLQMVELFSSTKQNISLHINNIFKEGELDQNSVVKYSLTTASDGKKYNTAFYNLDIIISVGYRVKSQRGTQFRIWANGVLKDYLLKGYALHNRIERIEKKLLEHDNTIDIFIKNALPPHEGIFYDGQIFDAYVFVSNIIKSAKHTIVLIDNYIDESILTLLTKRGKNVLATIYTNRINEQTRLDLERHNSQYPTIGIKQFSKSHDRFLIIDNQTIFHIGASLKDLGKKWFAFSKINLDASELISKLN